MTPRAWLLAEDGQTMAEYAVVLSVVMFVLIAVFTSFGLAVLRLYDAARALMP